MVYTSDIQPLISQWETRLKDRTDNPAYLDALSDCIYDLKRLLSDSIEEQLSPSQMEERFIPDDYLQWLMETEADNIESSIEAHDAVYV